MKDNPRAVQISNQKGVYHTAAKLLNQLMNKEISAKDAIAGAKLLTVMNTVVIIELKTAKQEDSYLRRVEGTAFDDTSNQRSALTAGEIEDNDTENESSPNNEE